MILISKGFFYRLGVAIKDFGERRKLIVLINAGLVVKRWASR